MNIVASNKITPSEKQQECIEHLSGPVMVLAGPGTGKTFTVIQRLKHMLSSGIAPESILCLTFSETAASEMKTRLIKEVGTKAASLKIGTYHAFCNELIAQYPMEFELFDNVNVIDDITRYKIMKSLFEEYSPKELKTQKGDFYYYIKPVINCISDIKNTRTNKEDYFRNLKEGNDFGEALEKLQEKKKEKEEKGDTRVKTLLKDIERKQESIAKAKEVWDIYELYTTKLRSQNYIDFNDMINFVLDKFDNDSEFLKKVSAQYKYFLVDEYQDTSFSQNQLVFKLSEGSESDNVFVVGDDDQIIYGFQGAQSDNLEKFLRYYKNTKVICLDENRRSTQNILDFSYEIMKQDNQRLENNPEFSQFNISKKLTAKNIKTNAKNSPLNLYSFAQNIQEKNFIIEQIEKIIAQGNDKLSEIAVLVTKNEDARELAQMLESKQIPFQLKNNKNIFEITTSITVIFYLKTLLNPILFADKLFGLMLCEPFNFHPEDYSFLIEQSRINHKDFISNIKENSNKSWCEKATVHKFIEIYEAIKESMPSQNLKELVLDVINKTGILEFYAESEINRLENIQAISRIIDEVQNFSRVAKYPNLKGFIEHLDIAYSEDIELNIKNDDTIKNAIQLMTLHGSKGREFEYVFIPYLNAKKWEKKRNPNSLKLPLNKVSFDNDSEQLRLLFVGITRAKHSLYLSYSNQVDNKPQELTKFLNIQNCSHILDEHTIAIDEESYILEVTKSLSKLKFDYKKHLSSQLKEIVKNITLSPSSLNSYIECPRGFLYRQIYKIPTRDTDTKNLHYGTSIHKALERAVSIAIETRAFPTCKQVQDIFISKLNSMPIKNPVDRQSLLDRGINALTKYYPHISNTATERLYAVEFSLGKIPLDTSENIYITGKIDLIERNKDGTFCLYDYKTGDSKTGAGKKINEDAHQKYLNQIRFYKLAFELLNKDVKVSQAGLIYVEDFEKNYSPELCEQDNQTIKAKILEVHKSIQKLDFEPICQKQKSDACKYCDYKTLCKLNVI